MRLRNQRESNGLKCAKKHDNTHKTDILRVYKIKIDAYFVTYFSVTFFSTNAKLSFSLSSCVCVMSRPQMLVEIFEYLKPCDRREVQLVCRTFFDACHHPRFQRCGDHHLHFNYCELASHVPPVSVFMRSTRHFDALTLSNFDCDKPITDFWQKMGRHVEHLEFSGYCDFGIYLPQMLNNFVHLKTLKMDTDFAFTKRFACTLPHLERFSVTFNIHDGDDYADSDLSCLLAAMPNLCHIELLIYSGCFEAALPFILQNQSKIKGLTFRILPDDAIPLVNLLNCMLRMTKIKLEKLYITYFNNWLVLDELMAKQKSLKTVEIGTNTFPNKTLPSVKKLEISINDQVQSFEALKFLPNLEVGN